MSGDADIDSALIQAYVDLDQGLSIAGENFEFDPTQEDEYVELTINPSGSRPISLGAAGIDEHVGFMQLAFNVPILTGRAQLLSYAQEIRDEFIVGKGYTYNGQNVQITAVERSAIRRENKIARLVVSVFWKAQTIRPEI